MVHSIYNNSSLTIAKKLINKGEIIVYPTDTVYGLGVDATNCKAVKKLNKLKKRKQPYSIIVDSINMLKEYANITLNDEKKIKSYFPGSYTLIFKKKHTNLSKLISLNLDTVGIRIPKHHFCLNLVNLIKKPIVTTSVNVHGNETLNTIDAINKKFPVVSIFEDDKINKNSKGSTIIDFTENKGQLIRQGDGDYKS